LKAPLAQINKSTEEMNTMAFKLLDEALAPAEDEHAVRTYHCTTLFSRLLSLKAEGYLTVTNKRVVFYALGSSYAGKSVLQSEVPIADVSGISSYKGTSFSLMHLLEALGGSLIAGILISTIVGIASALVFAQVRSLRDLQTLQTLSWLLPIALIVWSLFVPRDKVLRSILAGSGALLTLGLSGINLTAGILGSFGGGSRGGGGLGIITALLAGVYALACFFWYARRKTISLTVGSKGGSNTPIAISGISGFGAYNTAALRALTAEPATDAEAMIKELGAMITDIQALGIYGSQKWTEAQVSSAPPQVL
jgi:hypothetical protein